jgi:hypothetical protein
VVAAGHRGPEATGASEVGGVIAAKAMLVGEVGDVVAEQWVDADQGPEFGDRPDALSQAIRGAEVGDFASSGFDWCGARRANLR